MVAVVGEDLFEPAGLLGPQNARDLDSQGDVEVARGLAATGRDAFAAQPQSAAAVASRGHPERHRALEGGQFDLCALDGFDDRNGKIHGQVALGALQVSMGPDAHPGEQISSRTALAAGSPLARQADSASIVDAAGNSNGQALSSSRAIGLGTLEFHALFTTPNGLDEVEVEDCLEVRALSGSRRPARMASTAAGEQVFEEISEAASCALGEVGAAKASTETAPEAPGPPPGLVGIEVGVDGDVAELVVIPPPLFVREDRVGARHPFEALFRCGIAGVAIRMMGLGELAIRLLDGGRVGVTGDAQLSIQIFFLASAHRFRVAPFDLFGGCWVSGAGCTVLGEWRWVNGTDFGATGDTSRARRRREPSHLGAESKRWGRTRWTAPAPRVPNSEALGAGPVRVVSLLAAGFLGTKGRSRIGRGLNLSERERFNRIYSEVCGARQWLAQPSEVEVKLESGRRQIVYLQFFDHQGRSMVRFYTVIGSTERIKPVRLQFALEINYQLPHGAMAVKGSELVMTDTLILADADPSEIEASLAYLAETADHYEASMFGPDVH